MLTPFNATVHTASAIWVEIIIIRNVSELFSPSFHDCYNAGNETNQ